MEALSFCCSFFKMVTSAGGPLSPLMSGLAALDGDVLVEFVKDVSSKVTSNEDE